MVSSLLRSNGARQILGAAIGMAIATILYVVINELPSMQITKGLLVDSSATISSNVGQVQINEKNVDSETYKRIAARARQIAYQMENSNKVARSAASLSSEVASSVASIASSAQPAVRDHVDRMAWLAMREAQRKQNAAFDVSIHQAASSSIETVATVVSPHIVAVAFPTVNDKQPVQTAAKAPLPNAGMGLNLIVLVAFILAVKAMLEERRRALIRIGSKP